MAIPRVRRIAAVVLLPSATLAASDAYPPPRFSDRDRVQKLESALPEIDRIFRGYAEEKKIPGMGTMKRKKPSGREKPRRPACSA